MHQYFIPFYDWIIYHFTGIPEFIHSSVNEHADYFYLLVNMNKVVMDICAQVFVWTYVFIPLYFLEVEIDTLYGNCLIFEKLPGGFLKQPSLLLRQLLHIGKAKE